MRCIRERTSGGGRAATDVGEAPRGEPALEPRAESGAKRQGSEAEHAVEARCEGVIHPPIHQLPFPEPMHFAEERLGIVLVREPDRLDRRERPFPARPLVRLGRPGRLAADDVPPLVVVVRQTERDDVIRVGTVRVQFPEAQLGVVLRQEEPVADSPVGVVPVQKTGPGGEAFQTRRHGRKAVRGSAELRSSSSAARAAGTSA